jgi:hypothetical protein
MYLSLAKNVLGYIFGDFFTSSSGHPGPQLTSPICEAANGLTGMKGGGLCAGANAAGGIWGRLNESDFRT